MSTAAILCVDDEAIVGLSMRLLLKSHLGPECDVEIATGAQECLEIAEEYRDKGERVALLITDWLMPGMKGDELIKRVRSLYPDARTVLVSGHADAEAVSALLEQDELTVFLKKPWDDKVLLQIVDEALGRHGV